MTHARVLFLRSLSCALLVSLLLAGCGDREAASTKTEQQIKSKAQTATTDEDPTDPPLGVDSTPQDAPATWLEDLGCSTDTTPTVVAIGDPDVRAPLDAGIRDATAAVLVSDEWKAGDTTLDRAALAKQLELGTDTRYACDAGRLYVYAPLSAHPGDVCPVDLMGFYSTSDGSTWTADHVDCAGDIGPICRHTPKQLRSVWYPRRDEMKVQCDWLTTGDAAEGFVGG